MKKLLMTTTESKDMIACCSFKTNNIEQQISHSYLIESIEKDNGLWVILSNPHESEKEIKISMKDFLKFYDCVTIATIPDKIQ